MGSTAVVSKVQLDKLELRLQREGVAREVLLFEAASEDALRRTHRRYFEKLEQLVDARVEQG